MGAFADYTGALERAKLLFFPPKLQSLEEENRALRVRIDALNAELSKYGEAAIRDDMINQRHQETQEMRDMLTLKYGFKYTHIAAEQRIDMLEKKIKSLQAHSEAGWEAYNKLERGWLKFLHECWE
jgi:predicted RNase H-like nuclease (RuvC/YqgF family)